MISLLLLATLALADPPVPTPETDPEATEAEADEPDAVPPDAVPAEATETEAAGTGDAALQEPDEEVDATPEWFTPDFVIVRGPAALGKLEKVLRREVDFSQHMLLFPIEALPKKAIRIAVIDATGTGGATGAPGVRLEEEEPHTHLHVTALPQGIEILIIHDGNEDPACVEDHTATADAAHPDPATRDKAFKKGKVILTAYMVPNTDLPVMAQESETPCTAH